MNTHRKWNPFIETLNHLHCWWEREVFLWWPRRMWVCHNRTWMPTKRWRWLCYVREAETVHEEVYFTDV